VIGTRESAVFNSILVVVKLCALTAFLALSLPVMRLEHFQPFAPLGTAGVSMAAASIFFAFVGFDAVATAAEETKNPGRNMPIGILGSLAICTVFYLLVAAGVIGAVGAQPLFDSAGAWLTPGSSELAEACRSAPGAVVCSREALAFVLREIGWPQVANLLGLAVGFALPSVVLLMMFGQTRIFFVMSRDGLLPEVFSRVHPRYKTPHIITCVTGVFVAFFAAFVPLGRLADLSNAGTLFAFFMVAVAVMVLRKHAPERPRPFLIRGVWLIGPLAAFGCLYLLWSLGSYTQMLAVSWAVIGIGVYFLYGYRKSHLARGIVEPASVPGPIPGAE
jgi:APA family basic amino acid/polyamine antiporter